MKQSYCLDTVTIMSTGRYIRPLSKVLVTYVVLDV